MARTRTSRLVRRAAFAVGVLPLAAHVIWWLGITAEGTKLVDRHELVVASLPRLGATDPYRTPIRVIGVYSDIFDLSPRDPSRNPDVIVVTATLDPLVESDDALLWTSNVMVRSAVAYAVADAALLDSMRRALIVEMTRRNSRFVREMLQMRERDIPESTEYFDATL